MRIMFYRWIHITFDLVPQLPSSLSDVSSNAILKVIATSEQTLFNIALSEIAEFSELEHCEHFKIFKFLTLWADPG